MPGTPASERGWGCKRVAQISRIMSFSAAITPAIRARGRRCGVMGSVRVVNTEVVRIEKCGLVTMSRLVFTNAIAGPGFRLSP